MHEALTLDVAYHCRSSQPLSFVPEGERAQPFLSNFAGGRIEAVNGLVEAHYRFDLGGYARAINTPAEGIQRGKGVLMPIGGWLLEPRGFQRVPMIDIRVRTPAGMAFSTGLPKVGDAWRLAGTTVRFAGYTALGRFELHELVVPAPGILRPGQPKKDAVLRLALLEGFAEARARRSSTGCSAPPRPRPTTGTASPRPSCWSGWCRCRAAGVGFGRTQPAGGATIMVEVGADVDPRRLFNDWVLVHELVHSGMPFIRGRSTWFMEGSATYVEPIIRARAGWKTEEAVWKEWVSDMPQGVGVFPRGLPTASGRENYWGGAIFMLLADLGIRRESNGAKGLEDCLAGALWERLDGVAQRAPRAYIAACNRATGTKAMSELIDRTTSMPTPPSISTRCGRTSASRWSTAASCSTTARRRRRWRKMIVMGPPGRTPRPSSCRGSHEARP